MEAYSWGFSGARIVTGRAESESKSGLQLVKAIKHVPWKRGTEPKKRVVSFGLFSVSLSMSLHSYPVAQVACRCIAMKQSREAWVSWAPRWSASFKGRVGSWEGHRRWPSHALVSRSPPRREQTHAGDDEEDGDDVGEQLRGREDAQAEDHAEQAVEEESVSKSRADAF